MSGSPASWGTGKTAATSATFNNNAANAIYEPKNQNSTFHYINEDFSWALWLKKDYSLMTAAAMWAFTVGRADAGGWGYGLRIKSTSAVQAWFGSSTWSISSVPDNEWHHIVFTRSGTAIKMYRDGTLVTTATFSGALPTYSDGYGVGIGCFHHSGYIYPLIGSIQDFRIYDHALSQKEVVELAKGLMLHYTLDNPYTTGIYNFYSGTNAHGEPSGNTGPFTITKLANEDGYNFKLTRTGTGSSSWPNLTFPGLSNTNFTAGKKYTWSAKVRCHKWTSGSFALRNAIARNDFTNGGVNVCTTSLADGQWHQYSRTITLTEGMNIGTTFYYLTEGAYNASTETTKAYMSPRVEFFSSDQKTEGTVYDMDFDIKEVQLIESDSFPGWVDNTMASNTVRDNTGRGNDATCYGSVTTTTGSPRNLRTFQFSGGACLWPVPDPIKSTTTEFTISVWFKTTTVSGNQCIWNGRTTVGAAVSIFLVGSGIRVDDSSQTTSVSVSTNTWYHLAVTWKSGGNKVIYLNGEQKTSVAAGTLSKSNAYASIGRSSSGNTLTAGNLFSGQMSDFRIYATALTADQVKELYNAPISVANTGACISEQFTEGAAGISFAKTGVVSCNGISSLPGKYDPEVLIEPDGSCWAHIGHHADPTTYKFSSDDPFATGVWKDGRRFLDASYCDLVDKWEFIATQRATATADEQRFRWVQTKNPNVAVYEDVVAAAVTKYTAADGYTNMNSTYGGIYKFNTNNTYYVMTNGTKGNWYGAIGAWNAWNGGIPGINNTAVKDGGHLDLYIRIDNVIFTSNRTGCSLDKGGNGVLSPEFVEQ